jgi:diguanylate cyclase (GGDEF)-like protein
MGLPARDVFDVVFVMVDLDNFKEINDTFGHPEGDKVLVQMRDVLLEACRESDIVIRWGGDEFLVVGRDTDPDRAEALAHRIRSSIEEKVFTLDEGQVLRTTASVGFACFPFVRTHPDMVTWEQVLAMADDALYAAKHLSRNAWVGFMSTLKSGESQDLVRTIRDDAGRAADHGIIEIRSSIPDTKWMVPDDIGAQPSFPGEH